MGLIGVAEVGRLLNDGIRRGAENAQQPGGGLDHGSVISVGGHHHRARLVRRRAEYARGGNHAIVQTKDWPWFADPVPTAACARVLDRVLALSGRDPAWTAVR
jgi:hypothetical protein